MRPDNLEFYGDKNIKARLSFRADWAWGGFTANTSHGQLFGTHIVISELPSDQVGLDAREFMEAVPAEAIPGLYKKASAAGDAILSLIVKDPSQPTGYREEPVINDHVIELAPLPHAEQPKPKQRKVKSG